MHVFMKDWKNDLPASLVVFLVAVPLCLGIALASGAPLFSGIISGIVGGIVVTLISDSALGVSGPAAGLVAIVAIAINDLGFETFLLAVLVSGLFQIALGLLRCGIIGYYFPTSVIKGMLAAIGLIIILKQIPHALGDDMDFEGDLAFQQSDGHNTFSEIASSLRAITPGSIVICAICLAIVIFWERPFMKRSMATKIIQGPLVAVLAGIALHLSFSGNSVFALCADQLVALPIAKDIPGFFSQFTFPDFSAFTLPGVYVTALTLAVVAEPGIFALCGSDRQAGPSKTHDEPESGVARAGNRKQCGRSDRWFAGDAGYRGAARPTSTRVLARELPPFFMAR